MKKYVKKLKTILKKEKIFDETLKNNIIEIMIIFTNKFIKTINDYDQKHHDLMPEIKKKTPVKSKQVAKKKKVTQKK